MEVWVDPLYCTSSNTTLRWFLAAAYVDFISTDAQKAH